MKPLRAIAVSPAAVSLACALAALAVYSVTMAPGLTYIDSGELATVASRLAVAHPTGYPLFTLVGRLFTLLPLGDEPIARLNLMAAMFCAAAVGFFFFFVRGLLRALDSREGRAGGRGDTLITVSAAGGSLVLAFSRTFWQQALAIEVYSLHVLLMTAALAVFVRGVQSTEQEGPGRWLVLSAFLVGLSFTNHMTTVLLIPGLLTWFLLARGWERGIARQLVRYGIPVLGALSLYLYIPIRASREPVPNWGYAATAERFLWHVSGKQYRVWIFSSGETAIRQFREFFSGLPSELGYLPIPLAVAGLVLLWRWHRPAFWGSTVMFVTCVVYSSNYDIHDIDPYYLLALAMLVLWSGVGLYWLGVALRGLTARARSWAAAALFVPAALSLILHAPDLDASDDYAVEDYTRNMFASLEPGALVLSFQWDYWLSASYYVQLVRGERPDVVVIDKELLRRSWYIREIRRRFPQVTEPCGVEIEAFRRELEKFENGTPYSPRVIQARFEEMIRAMVARSLASRPVYVTPEIEPEFTAGFQRVPAGLAMRIYADTIAHDLPFPHFEYRPLRKSAEMDQNVGRFYASAFLMWGEYRFTRFRDVESLIKSSESALVHFPGDPRALEILRRFPR